MLRHFTQTGLFNLMVTLQGKSGITNGIIDSSSEDHECVRVNRFSLVTHQTWQLYQWPYYSNNEAPCTPLESVLPTKTAFTVPQNISHFMSFGRAGKGQSQVNFGVIMTVIKMSLTL